MATNKRKYVSSPVGEFKYIWVNKPDTKFSKDGDYHLTIVLPPAQAKQFESELQAVYDEFKAEAGTIKKESGLSNIIKDANTFSFKARAGGVDKNGQPWSRKIGVFDGALNPIPDTVPVYSGSRGLVEVVLEYRNDSTYGYRLKPVLRTVQITELKTGSNKTGTSLKPIDGAYVYNGTAVDDDVDNPSDSPSDY